MGSNRIAAAALAVLLGLGAGFGLEPPAHAQEEPREPEATPELVAKLDRLQAAVTAYVDRSSGGDYSGARDALIEAIDLSGEVPAGHLPPDLVPNLVSSLGQIQAALGEFVEAERNLERALELYRLLTPDVDHPRIAFVLLVRGQMYTSWGRLEDALSSFEAAHASCRRLFKEPDPLMAQAESLLGNALLDLGRYPRALERLEAAVAQRREIHGADHPLAMLDQLSIARVLASLRRPEEGLKIARAALAAFRRLASGDDVNVALALNRVASLLLKTGRPAEGVERARESVEMQTRLIDRGETTGLGRELRGFLRVCLADGLRHMGRVRESLEEIDVALEEIRGVYGADHLQVVSALGSRALSLSALGRFEDAIEVHREALAMARRMLPESHTDIASTLNNLGSGLRNLGSPADALPYYEEALAIARRLADGDDHSVAVYLMNIGSCLNSLGRPEDAVSHDDEAVQMLRRLGAEHDYAVALGNLGVHLSRLGRHHESRAAHEEVLTIQRRLFPGDHPDLARSMANVAAVRSETGKPEEAIELHREALAMRRRLFGETHPSVAHGLSMLAVCLESVGEAEEALRRHTGALEILRKLNSPETHEAASRLADFHLARSEPEKAAALYGEAVEQIEALRGRASGLDEEGRASLYGHLKRLGAFEGMVRALLALERPAEALGYVERARARSLLDLLARSDRDPLEEARSRAESAGDGKTLSAIRTIEAELVASDREIARLTYEAGVARGRRDLLPGARRGLLEEIETGLRVAHTAQRQSLRRRAGLVRKFVPLAAPLEPEEIQAAIEPGERMLVYSLARRTSHLFVVPPPGGEIRCIALTWPEGGPVTGEELAREVELLVASLARPGRSRGLGVSGDASRGDLGARQRSHRIFRALIPGAIRKEILGVERLVVVPHGALHRLPFEALVVEPKEDSAGTRYWIDVAPPVVYGPSATVHRWSRKRSRDRPTSGGVTEIVALGDPVFTLAEPPEPPESGILVLAVTDGSNAARAGLRPGDVLLAYAGAPVPDLAALRAGIDGAEGTKVALRIWREGAVRTVSADSGRLGIELSTAPLPKALAEYHGGKRERSLLRERFGGLVPLPGTRREVERMREALAQVDGFRVHALLGEDARESRLYDLAPRARILHLATHHLADETETASASCLALTLPQWPTSEDDGFLRLGELLLRWGDRIRGCELVVLSACETQRGRMQMDEAVFAMPVGFLFAGASSVIGSLWRVDDDSTAELMATFYRRLAEKRDGSKLAAFHQARKALRKVHPHPYHWAPFVYLGAPR